MPTTYMLKPQNAYRVLLLKEVVVYTKSAHYADRGFGDML